MKSLLKSTPLLLIFLLAFTDPATLTVTSAAFSNGGNIPAKYTCEGQSINPPLKVAHIPAGAKSLAIIVHDPDAPLAGGFYHWVAWNLPTDGDIPENFKASAQGLNGAGKPGYMGPCPPTGSHRYHFKVYALDVQLQLPANTDHAALEKAMQGHILAEGILLGLYDKAKM